MASSDMSLGALTRELNARGFSIAQATLSYWKSGRSVPRRASSFPIVEEIEKILNLVPGVLLAALNNKPNNGDDVLRSMKYFAGVDMAPQYADTYDKERFQLLDAGVEWENEARREILDEEIVISSDFMFLTKRTTVVARAMKDSGATLHVSASLEPEEMADKRNNPEIYDIEGAEVLSMKFIDGGATSIVELGLPDKPAPCMHRVAYSYGFYAPQPFTEIPGRAFAWPLTFYTCSVVFEGEAPRHIEWIVMASDDGKDGRQKTILTQELTPVNNKVQVSVENIGNCIAYMRWGN